MKVVCLYAALANGIISHALELDDGNRFAQGHPGVSVISVDTSVVSPP